MRNALQGGGDGYYGGGSTIISSTAAILLFFFLQPSSALIPSIYMDEFTVFALKPETTNSTGHNNTIHFKLEVNGIGINHYPTYYDAFNLTFYYKPANNSNLSSSFLIGNATFRPFYQRKNGFDYRVGNFEARGVKWENATLPLVFRVELATGMRYQLNTFFKSKRERFVIEAELKVDSEGNLITKKHKSGVELWLSRASPNNMSCFQMLTILFLLFFFHSF